MSIPEYQVDDDKNKRKRKKNKKNKKNRKHRKHQQKRDEENDYSEATGDAGLPKQTEENTEEDSDKHSSIPEYQVDDDTSKKSAHGNMRSDNENSDGKIPAIDKNKRKRKKNKKNKKNRSKGSSSDDGSSTDESPDRSSENSSNYTPTDESESEEESTNGKKKKKKSNPFRRPENNYDIKHGVNKEAMRKFEVMARTVKTYQLNTTYSEKDVHNDNPKCRFFMYSYDEMVKDPKSVRDSRCNDAFSYYRSGKDKLGKFTFLVPLHFDEKEMKEMGKRFRSMGRDMQEGKWSGDNYKFVENIRDHHYRLYAKKYKFNGKLGKKKQLQRSIPLGPGYGVGKNSDDGNKKKKKNKK